MQVLHRLANATSSAADAAMQPVLLVERFTDMIPSTQKLSPGALAVVAIGIAGIILGTLGVLCAACVLDGTCGRCNPAHRLSKPKSHARYLTQVWPKPRRGDQEHNPRAPHTPASVVMNDWTNKNDSSDSVGPQYVGARSTWGPTPGYGVAGHQPRCEEFASAAPLTVPPKVAVANRF
ncbi:hypothetical protein DL762_004346 [Monosporascus cannonballus]|uniref:Uncharacterized protein n=1 Tax=Monosporascus cannonballus TaxID=155416 RepID=A0ABY0HAV6_9PEZI|nr:hypothetical protein DL762_004346 [Monosporascus cannonballus]